MKSGMTLDALLTQVRRHALVKKDFVASTSGSVRMLEMKGFQNEVAFVLLKEGAGELQRFEINETAHRQIAAHLEIPYKYYERLLNDHRDLVITQVNALFEREPSTRLIRTLDGHVRAFLSNKYQRLDNQEVLAKTLPVMMSRTYANELLTCNVSEERLDIKCVFTDPELRFTIGTAPNGQPDTMKPGFHLSNSEVGKGSLSVKGFFYRDYCRNGAVYGSEEMLTFRRSHVGGRLIEGTEFEVISDATKKLDDAAIISGVTDTMKALASPEFVQQMADKLGQLKSGGNVDNPVLAMPNITRELDLNETESARALENLIRDRDYSRWGVLNAVTELANQAETYERANELEALADKVLTMPVSTWNRVRVGVPVEARRAA
jgi:hypothetical protein